jgi:hypothetical protein
VRPPFAAGQDRAEGEEIKAPFCRVFTLEADGRPILAFEAGAIEKPNRFATSLGFLRSFSFEIGRRFAAHSSIQTLGTASAPPKKRLPSAKRRKMNNLADDMPLVYLIKLDAQENRS